MPRKTTRNAQGGGSIRKRADGTWEGRYTLGRDPGTGKQIQKSVYGKTQAEVRKKLQAATTSIDEGNYFEPSKITLSQWLDIWLSEYMGDKKYLTVKGYKAQVNTHIKPALGAVKLSALAPHDIQKFYNSLQKEGHTITRKDENGEIVVEHKPLATKSVRNVHGVLTKALSVAANIGYIKGNPAERVTLPRVEKKEIKPLTDEQVTGLLKIADMDEYGAIFKTIIFTGLREAEATGLTWDCVDFKTGRITICKQLQKRPNKDGGFTFAPLKNDKVRVIAPAPFVMQVLEEQRKKQIADRLKAGTAWQAWSTSKEQETAFVFTNAIGQHLHPQTVYNHLKKLAAQVGAPDACVHDLRHTFAVLSLQNGDDVKTVQGNLGHATAAFTLDVYGHVSERMREDSAARMQNYIDKMKQI
jgi:integrase